MAKIPLFYQKIVEKICVYQNKVVPLHRQTKTNNNSKTITIMKTYITKFLGNGKEEFVAKFNSYKEARQYLNSLWLKYNTAGIKVFLRQRLHRHSINWNSV